MMKKLSKVLAIVLTLAIAVTCFAGCGSKNDTIRVGIHSNISGAVLVAIANDMGYFEEEGLTVDTTVVESGPVEMAAMRAGTRTLEVGYIGSGVAWNALDGDGNGLSFVYFNGLGDAESMLAREGVFTDSNNNGMYDIDEIGAGLKGQTVYLDTSTTPASWFKTLLKYVNADLAAADQVWISCETADYLAGYEAPNADEANKVEVVHISNANVASAMSTTSASRADIAVCFAPIPYTILEANDDVELIAKTSTHFAVEDSSIETFVASNEWIKEDPESVQKFVNALTKAAAYRNDNIEYATAISEEQCNAQAGTFDAGVAWWPTVEDYKEMFATTDGLGYDYMEALYNLAKPNVASGNVKDFDDCIDFSFMMKSFG